MGLSSSAVSAEPRESLAALYRERLVRSRSTAAHLDRRHIWLGYVRLTLGAILVLLAWPAVHQLWPWGLSALWTLGLFAVTAAVHSRTLAALARQRRIEAFYAHGLARMDDRWAGLHPRATRLSTEASLFASDLDLFRPGGLFELLCTARTSLGEDALARWLLAPATVAEVLARQDAVQELGSCLALREHWASVPAPAFPRSGSSAAGQPLPAASGVLLDQPALCAWAKPTAEEASPALPRWLRWAAPLLLVLTVLAALRYALAQTPVLLLAALLLDLCLTFLLRSRYLPLFRHLEHTGEALGPLPKFLSILEQEHFQSPWLRQLQAGLRCTSGSASSALRQLHRLAALAEGRANYIVRLLDNPLLYSVQLALAVQRWRTRFGAELHSWLDRLGEFEALLSLATYHAEHPEDRFPEFLASSNPTYAAQALGHPLLPASACVRNDVEFSAPTRLLIVSGSNMSGKSTLMRSVGTSLVLAQAGAPVRAQRLVLSPMRLAASIQVQDSLLEGRSRFFAEILRLRSIAEMAHSVGDPVFFLLDELLAGTNSRDRLQGAQGLVRDLLRAGAMGLLSTHDLALTGLGLPHEHSTQGMLRNVHFVDHFSAGELQFDYRLREGVVERSNGVELMRLLGLNV